MKSAPTETAIRTHVLVEALRCFDNGDDLEAEKLCHACLRDRPGTPDALELLGRIMHRRGRTDIGISLIEQAIAAQPDNPGFRYRLGRVLQDLDRIDAAIDQLQAAIDLDPASSKARRALGAALLFSERLAEAETCYRRALLAQPDDAPVLLDLANVLLAMHRTDEAIAAFTQASAIDPQSRHAHHALAIEHHRRGHLDRAIQMLRWGLVFQPMDPELRYMLDAMSNDSVVERAPDEYIVQHFDQFSAFFDTQLLEQLGYEAPKLVVGAVEALYDVDHVRLDILDAGCGTGLCGPGLRPYARNLVGVDLSPGMLAKARERAVYDAVVEAELSEFLTHHVAAFDVIVAADVFVYFGDLFSVFDRIEASLRPGGYLIATFELAEDGVGYHHHPTGRYAHSAAFIQSAAEGSDLDVIEIAACHLREQWGRPVAGYLAIAKKPLRPAG